MYHQRVSDLSPMNISYFFLILFFLLPQKLLIGLLCFLVFVIWLLLFFFNFFHWLFNKSYLPFNLVIQFYFVIYYTFQFDPYSFDFFTRPFDTSFFFNFTLQSKFILYYCFQFDHLFFFVGVIFIFNLTFHAKLCVIFSFNFLFSSFSPLYRCYFFST